MVQYLLLVFALALLGFLVYVAMQSAEGTISRSALIPAEPSLIFPHVNDLRKWEAWSPWAKIDPASKVSYSGPQTGPNSSMAWSGNAKVGEGTMTIIESMPNDIVRIRLDFRRPFENTAHADLTFKPETTGTRVTWTMSGARPFLARVMCSLFNADKMTGAMFEQGLDNLRAVVTDRK